mmetsp:Transcript_1566/g.4047  ORF Transcript_1566/g.4047 Transcript_1566/m.4047 type:complete len:180 (-) Transcript_1566:345-884(-)
MPLWQKIVIPVSLVVVLLLFCACGVGIFCMCCKRHSSRSAFAKDKKPQAEYQFSVASAPAVKPATRGAAISNPVFDVPGGDGPSRARRSSLQSTTLDSSDGTITLSPARAGLSRSASPGSSPDRTGNAAGFGVRRPGASPSTSPSRGRSYAAASGAASRARRDAARGHSTWSSGGVDNV